MNIPDAIKISPLAMMGPGPSNVPESVLAALAQPTLGHLDPHFLHLMDEVRSMLRQLFVTENKVTLPVSATGSAAMETALFNAIEKDDRVIIGVNGVFSDRMAQIAERTGAEVVRVNGEWGRSLTVEDFRKAAAGRSFKAVGVVHAETSTGVLQRVEDFRAFADEVGGLLIVDAVASLAGMPFNTDELGVDIAFSASQKCLSCPPGLAPLTVSDHGIEIMNKRKSPVQSWYWDLSLINQYWAGDRAYHHTAPVNMVYSLHEGLRVALGEGLENRFNRHIQNTTALIAGLEAMDFHLPVREDERLPQLTVVRVPEALDDLKTRLELRDVHRIEIGAGLGPLKGKVWRIGLLGHTANPANVEKLFVALKKIYADQGIKYSSDPLEAARAVWAGFKE